MSQTALLEPTHLLESFVTAKLGQLAPQLYGWFTSEALSQNLRAELEEDLEWTHNLEWAEQFQGNIGVGQPQDYLVRTLELPVLGTAWTHIRFRGGDRTRPFVDLRSSLNLPRSSGPPREADRPGGAALSKTVAQLGQDANRPGGCRSAQDSADFKAFLEPIRDEYSVFTPKHLRLFLPDMSTLEPLPDGAFWEKRYLAAPIAELKQKPMLERLEVRPLSDGFYARYLEVYRELQAAWPEHAEYAGVEDASDFQGTDGAALEVWVDGEYAGLVAASRAIEQGLRGFVVDEVTLSKKFRGQGLGPAALRGLVEHLPALAEDTRSRLEGDVLFGTVDLRNLPAYRSALRSGRVDVGGYLWVPLEK